MLRESPRAYCAACMYGTLPGQRASRLNLNRAVEGECSAHHNQDGAESQRPRGKSELHRRDSADNPSDMRCAAAQRIALRTMHLAGASTDGAEKGTSITWEGQVAFLILGSATSAGIFAELVGRLADHMVEKGLQSIPMDT